MPSRLLRTAIWFLNGLDVEIWPKWSPPSCLSHRCYVKYFGRRILACLFFWGFLGSCLHAMMNASQSYHTEPCGGKQKTCSVKHIGPPRVEQSGLPIGPDWQNLTTPHMCSFLRKELLLHKLVPLKAPYSSCLPTKTSPTCFAECMFILEMFFYCCLLPPVVYHRVLWFLS